MAELSPKRAGIRLGLMPTVFATVAALYFCQAVLIPLAIAILLAFLMAPLVTRLERTPLGRVIAVLITVGVMLSAVGAIGWVVERQFVAVAEALPDYRQNIENKFQRFRTATHGKFSKAANAVEDTLNGMATTQPSTPSSTGSSTPRPPVDEIRDPGSGLPQVSPQNPLPVREYASPRRPLEIYGQYLGRLQSPLATFGLVVVFVVFMLLHRRDLRDRMIRLVGHGRLNITTQALDDAATRISRYLRLESTVNLVYGVCVGIGLWIIGAWSAEGQFPNVLLWGLLATVFRFIPYVGWLIGAAAPLILSLAAFNSAGVFAATLGLYVGLESITGNLLEPWLYGSGTGLSAMAILVSGVFWTWLWGPVGLLLSTPLTVCMVVLGKYVPQLRFLDVILGDEQVLEPSVRVYQRLLSLDQEEAAEILHEYRKEKGLEFVYDNIMIPALAMAEKDRGAGELDAEREVFVGQALRELIDEMGEAQKKEKANEVAATAAMVAPAATAGADASSSTSETKATVTPTPKRPDSGITVLCLPAHNEADEIVGLMLAQLLEVQGQRVMVASRVSLASEMLDLIEAHGAEVVCISALPPAAVTHARHLCRRLHGRSPNLPTLVGLWTSKADSKKSLDRLLCENPLRLVTSLGQAMVELDQIALPLLLNRANVAAADALTKSSLRAAAQVATLQSATTAMQPAAARG